MGKIVKMSFEGKNLYGQYIDYSEKTKWPKGFICPYTGTIFYNIPIYSRSQVSVYRTIGPLVDRYYCINSAETKEIRCRNERNMMHYILKPHHIFILELGTTKNNVPRYITVFSQVPWYVSRCTRSYI